MKEFNTVEALLGSFQIDDSNVIGDYDAVLQSTLDGINNNEELSAEQKQEMVEKFQTNVAEFNKSFNMGSKNPVLDYIAKSLELNLPIEKIKEITELYASKEFAMFHELIDEGLKHYSNCLIKILDTQYGFEDDFDDQQLLN